MSKRTAAVVAFGAGVVVGILAMLWLRPAEASPVGSARQRPLSEQDSDA